MTTDLEKQFFDTFGIKPKEEKYCYWECKKPELENVICNNTECEHYRHEIHYPYISDHILLELICIAHTSPVITFCSRNVVNLKNEVLNVLCNYIDSRDIKHQVQALFKEER